MRVATSKVNVATAALAVVSPHGEPKSVAIDLVANFNGCALPGVGLEHLHARLTGRGNIGYLNAVARSRVIARLAGLSLQNHGSVAHGPHHELRGRSAEGDELRRAWKISELIAYDRAGVRGGLCRSPVLT
jgi:hypothetical protein